MSELHSSPPGVTRWLLGVASGLRSAMVLACLLACITRFVSLAMYLIAGLGLLRVLGLSVAPWLPQPTLVLSAALLIGLGLLKGLVRYAEQYVGHRVAFLALSRLRSVMYRAYERQAPFGGNRRSGAMLSKATSDIDRVEVFFAHTLPPAVAALVVSVGASLFVWSIAGPTPAAALAAGYIMLGLVVPGLGLRTVQRAVADTARARTAQSQALAETLRGAETIADYGAERAMLRRVMQRGPDSLIASKAAWMSGVRSALVAIVPWLSAIVVLAVGPGSVQPGELVLVLVLCVPSFEAVRAVEGFVLSLQDSLASARRLYDVDKAPVTTSEGTEAPAVEGTSLIVRQLSAGYAQGAVVQDIDFHVAGGGLLAVLGGSGSGKSTVAAALVRSIESDGQMQLGGVDLRTLPLDQLRERILLVAQTPVLIRGSVRENLLLGRDDITDEQLREVLQELGLASWLAAQKSGLDTRLGERGSRLSGGQRQRLGIARALLRQPQVLILDESTSALDADSESLVFQALQRRLHSGMAAIMVSHRLSVLPYADTALVLHDGRVVETATPQTLIARSDSMLRAMIQREAGNL
ncbi:ABC transporter ATP-binding protein [Glutamicibacter sp. PS]|uniref:amino acid ABC transporter ATP-binding/permease protein n=1 Tax=Glutamicibacter sp. PS TaxID=3075634 RepID=UPI00284A207C|nr:ABC transporter ATP-binding protein [Glutamicibacter sp. PS]MDR4534068.1 ABC transporter ATP-binding protein/permease [Glutamicibacter sp. PS]